MGEADAARERLLQRHAARQRDRAARATVQARRDALNRKRSERREHIRTTARDRALRRGLDVAAAELAGQQALEEMDRAAREKRARPREVSRHPDALAQIEAQELWLDLRLPLRERIFAAMRVRQRTSNNLSQLLRDATRIAAQLEAENPTQWRARLRAYVARRTDDLLAPLPEAPPPDLPLLPEQPRPGIRAALARAFNQIWSRAADAASARRQHQRRIASE